MTNTKAQMNRRSFLKASALSGGGLLISFSWLNSFGFKVEKTATIADERTGLNGFLKIAEDGIVTIMSPNPEGGQNVKTSMPMIVADELDVDWKNVIVEQAPLNTQLYTRQFIGGSQAIRTSWRTLRTAGASARLMLREAAAQTWTVPLEEISTEKGILYHKKSGKSAGYGAMANLAAKMVVPKEVKLKDKKEFSIIGTPAKNVEGHNIVSGKPLFGIDIQREGMLFAMIVHPPAFGMKVKSVDDSSSRLMPGIKDIFPIKVLKDDYVRQMFDTCTFSEVIAIVGNNTWNVMNAKKALKIEWEPVLNQIIKQTAFGGGEPQAVPVPPALESTEIHKAKMAEMKEKPARVVRKDGDPETAFKNAAQIIERTYTAPFLAHNCMEPMNFFAHVTNEKVELAGAVENYLAESWSLTSNITTGSFRAPRSNFIAGAEQSFMDEIAEAAGKDPIAVASHVGKAYLKATIFMLTG